MRIKIIAIACLAILAPSSAWAVRYTAVDLGTLGGSASFAKGINNKGQVVGSSTNQKNMTHAFLYDGNLHDIDGSNRAFSWASAINDSGKITGWYGRPRKAFLYDGSMHFTPDTLCAYDINNYDQVVGTTDSGFCPQACVYDGSVHNIGTLGGLVSSAKGINNSGVIVGPSMTRNRANHAFLYDGTMHDIGVLNGFTHSSADAINDSGVVIGSSYDIIISTDGLNSYTYGHAFIYDNIMRDLGGLPGYEYSAASGINSSGIVVGNAYTYSSGTNRTLRAFIYDGAMYDLNDFVNLPAGWILSSAIDINDCGQIACDAMNTAGETHAFLLTPIVPEPPSILALLLGSGLLVWQVKRPKIKK